MIIPKQDKVINALLINPDRLNGKLQASATQRSLALSDSNGKDGEKGKKVQFKDFYKHIEEDNFESDVDEEEQEKIKQLERLMTVTAPKTQVDNWTNEVNKPA